MAREVELTHPIGIASTSNDAIFPSLTVKLPTAKVKSGEVV